MKLPAPLPFLVALLHLSAAALFGAPATKPDLATLTGFSWDRVPVCAHFGKRTAPLTEAELDWIAAQYPILSLEKGHGASTHGSTEAGIAHTARELKKRNPKIKVLFYWNAFINWPMYDALEDFPDEWILKDLEGNKVMKAPGAPRPDISRADVREWWSEVAAQALRDAPLDGIFADALPQALNPGMERTLGPEKAAAIREGMELMMNLTKKKIGPDKILLANGIRTTMFREPLSWEGIDGLMIEHFAAFQTASAEDIKVDLESFQLAERAGKFICLKGWPSFNWIDREKMKEPREALLEQARTEIDFSLSCFLIAAYPGCFFTYSWGYTDIHGTIDSYEEFLRPLGPPAGPAEWDGYRAKRDFQHASVEVDLQARVGRIEWK